MTDCSNAASSFDTEQRPPASLAPATILLIEIALAAGGFGIGTGEFVIMGLLPEVAQTYGVTVPQAGHVISAYALGVVIGAPIIAALAAKLPRKTLLLLLMGLFAVGNFASALATEFSSFTLLRFITGLPHGAYFGVAALVAASMAPPNRRVRAVGRVMLGLTIATLVGTPIATFLGQMMSWRAAFFLVAAIGAITVALIALYLPRDEVAEGASIRRELSAFGRLQVWLSFGVAAVGFGGMFAIFSYIAKTVTDTAGLSASMVAVVLALFGIGMNVGNVVGSRMADYSLTGTIGGMLAFNIVLMAVFSLTAHNPVMLCICVFLTGCGFAACPAVQTRLMDVAADAQTLAAATQSFRLQHRQCARCLAWRHRDFCRLRLWRHGLCRLGALGPRPDHLPDFRGAGKEAFTRLRPSRRVRPARSPYARRPCIRHDGCPTVPEP